MHSPENCFTDFKQSIAAYSLPERFTFPFYYEPHPLCLLAASELQQHLETQTQWGHNFDVSGKMFGVLLVRNQHNEIGYLSAFSGKVGDQNLLAKFVPPVFDIFAKDSFFLAEQQEINGINEQIKELENNPRIEEFQTILAAEKQAAEIQLEAHRATMIVGRKDRKMQRANGEQSLNGSDLLKLKEQLSKESIREKNQLRDLKIYWVQRINVADHQHVQLSGQLDSLKQTRKVLSANLQQKLFAQYQFLNVNGAEKNLNDIFKQTPHQIPPAGSGECAAPKLLHYAFKWGMKPLALAEFWWGEAPKSEIRQHKNFYPSCQSKCQPILRHMLEDIVMDENPLLINPAEGKNIDIVYQDDAMLVINKPSEFLSVPGKSIEDSVYLRIKNSFPSATGPLIVHRLDMSTSGLMLIALTKRANKSLQKQFINRTIKKRYVALIGGSPEQDEGIINLPLRGDPDDRPRQLVCHEHGKPAETKWQVIERSASQTKVYLYPKTGRTHQLRVHCAHSQGLHMPIVGDDLYGNKDKRLHLHAESIEFIHPITKELKHFRVEARF